MKGSLTLNEAGYVVGQSSATINHAVDRGLIKATIQGHGKARLRRVGPVELRTLAVVAEVKNDLTPAARRKVYAAMRHLPADALRLEVGVLEFRLADVDRGIAERLRRLEALKSLAVGHADADPTIRGTDISVYVVAALSRGQSPVEICEDYPALTSEQVDAAVEYARIYPRPGRPLPSRSFKRMLRDAAASGAWDLESDDEPVAPRPIP